MSISTSETIIVRACLDWLAWKRIMAWRSNNTGIYDSAKKVFRTFQGLKGVADILGIFPQTVALAGGERVMFGNALAIEVKKPGEHPRPDQESFLQGIRDRGGIGICVHSVTEMEQMMAPFMFDESHVA